MNSARVLRGVFTDQQPQSPLNYDPKGVFILTGITGQPRRPTARQSCRSLPPQTNPVSAFSFSDNIAWVKKTTPSR
jgi:hypothetical protein